MHTFLSVFSKFRKPAKVHQAETLHNIFYRLLSNNNAQIQKAAFQCVLTWKSPSLEPYKDHFERLFAEATYKDELARFAYTGEKAVIAPQHQPEVVDIVGRIMWPRITNGKEVDF